ncbi:MULTISPECIES: PD-(D/E)XK motif protein [unclassified Micromonospora]|uniref:PD-(D/E)XK motif protein n=1 Tax=unclassified Micromonospora TaxID=2617518 RepID=UPI003327C027
MSDPWAGLRPAATMGTATAVRADPGHRWDCYWARDARGRRAWTMSVQTSSIGDATLPDLRGVELSFGDPDKAGKVHLWLALKDAGSTDLFHRLCVDIMEAAGMAPTEPDAVRRVIARTWRWHHLMRGAPSHTLTDSGQKGLVGELKLIEAHLIPSIGAKEAVTGWWGPLDGPKDFEFAPTAIEVKTQRGGAVPAVSISSEHQLDLASFEALYLVVFSVNEIPRESADAATLHGWVSRLRACFEVRAPWASDLLESRLAATGYREEDPYTNIWSIDGMSIYQVSPDFPRITPDILRPGVDRVRYQIELKEIDGFAVTLETMLSDLEAARE